MLLWRFRVVFLLYFCGKESDLKKSLWFIWLVFLAVVSVKAQNDTVVFSAKGGFYEESFALQLHHVLTQNHIRYTTNGNLPTAQSPLYTEPLVLDTSLYSKSDIYTIVNCPEQEFYLPDSVQHCIVIHAAVFDENDSCVSQVMTTAISSVLWVAIRMGCLPFRFAPTRSLCLIMRRVFLCQVSTLIL